MGENKFNTNDLIDKGLSAYQSGNYEEALEYYDKAFTLILSALNAFIKK